MSHESITSSIFRLAQVIDFIIPAVQCYDMEEQPTGQGVISIQEASTDVFDG